MLSWLRNLLTWRRLLALTLVTASLWVASSFLAGWLLTSRRQAPYAEPLPIVPWANFEEHRLATTDGQEIGVWFAEGQPGKPAVIVLHGHGGSRTQSKRLAKRYAEWGCTLLLVTLRAHGDSSGDSIDFGYSDKHDVVAAVDYLRGRFSGPILVQGQSQGATAAIFAAPLLDHKVQGYLLESPFYDLRAAVRHRTDHYLPPMFNYAAFAGLMMVGPVVLPGFEEIAPIDHIASIPPDLPVVLMGGKVDPLAPPNELEALFEKLQSLPRSEPARLVFFDKATHESLYHVDPALYAQEAQALLQRLGKKEPCVKNGKGTAENDPVP